MSAICFNELKGIGAPCENITPLTDAKTLVLARRGFAFTDAEDFATLASWKTAIADKNLYVLTGIASSENMKVEDGIYTGPFGDETHLWYGKRGKQYKFKLTKDQHTILFSQYSHKKWDLFELDRNGNIKGILNSDGTVSGSKLSYFIVKQQDEATEAEPMLTPVKFQKQDTTDWDERGCWLKPTWSVDEIEPITYVKITASTVATNVFTLTVAYENDYTFDTDGTVKGAAISGLGVDDLLVIDQTGAENTLASVVESSTTPGTYTVTGTTLTSGTVKVTPNTSNEDLYESDTATLTAA